MLQTVWGWQPALYLFLGGMGSGAFAMAAILYLTDKVHNKKIICVSMWAAVVSLVAGLLLLVSELTNPLRGMMMWQSFVNGTSWMTIGAWGLFATVAVFGVSALLATFRIAPSRERADTGVSDADDGKQAATGYAGKLQPWAARAEKPLSCLSAIGIALGVFIAAYTGVLLMSAPGVPLWNTPLLPCLFLVSGFDTGVALVELVAVVLSRREKLTDRGHRIVTRSTIGLIVVELVVMALFLAAMATSDTATSAGAAAAASAQMLVSGMLAPYFWGVVVAIGLVVPLVCALVSAIRSKREVESEGSGRVLVGALCVLVGGCELRFLILAAGLHADIVMDAFAAFIG